MKENLFKYYFKIWGNNFFIEPIIIITQIVILIFFIKKKHISPLLKPFALYILAGLILFIGSPASRFFFASQKKAFIIISEGLNMLFVIVEVFTFGYFYSKVLKSKWIKKFIETIIISLSIIFTLSLVHISISKYSVLEATYIIDKLTFIELLAIGILSSSYFFELFKFYNHSNLLIDPAFWISSCSILYSLVFPITLIFLNYMRINKHPHYNIFVSLHYFSLLIVYIGIFKSLLCTKPLSK